MLETVGQVVGAGWQSGKFLYVDTDLKIDLPEARVVDRSRAGGRPRARPGQRRARSWARCSAAAYVNRFNFFDRSYKVIPQIGEEDRATRRVRCSTSRSRRRAGELVPVSTFTHIETEHRAADAEPLPAAERGAGLRRREAGRHQGGGAARPGERRRAAAGGPGMTIDYAGESRQIRTRGLGADGDARASRVVLIYLVLAAQFQSFRDPLIVLLGSVPLAISGALLFSFLDLTTINIYSQVGLITLVGPDREERHPDRAVRQHAAGAGARQAGGDRARRR